VAGTLLAEVEEQALLAATTLVQLAVQVELVLQHIILGH
jgi:hypothetical protein